MCLCSAVALGWTAAHKFQRWCSFGAVIFLLPVQSLNLKVSSPFPGRRKRGRAGRLCSVFTGDWRGWGAWSIAPPPPIFPRTPPPTALFIHHSFGTFMWSTGWKFNLMTCLQARNMILKPVTVKQRCHLHNDPSKIGLQPLPWQLVDKQKNGGRASWMLGGYEVGGLGAWLQWETAWAKAVALANATYDTGCLLNGIDWRCLPYNVITVCLCILCSPNC